MYDDFSESFVVKGKGRHRLRKGSPKGGGKGPGRKGFRRFRSFRSGKGKGKFLSSGSDSSATCAISTQQGATTSGSQESTSETGTDSADLSKGKNKGKTPKKGKKGKGKSQAHVASELPAVPESAATSAGVDSPSWDFSWCGSGHCYMTVSLEKATSSPPPVAQMERMRSTGRTSHLLT